MPFHMLRYEMEIAQQAQNRPLSSSMTLGPDELLLNYETHLYGLSRENTSRMSPLSLPPAGRSRLTPLEQA